MKIINLLVLEDDLKTLSVITGALARLENELYPHYSFSITVFSTYHDVQGLVNTRPSYQYDIVLLDRDCKIGGSFHVLDMSKFEMDKIIAISMVEEYNNSAMARGVKHAITKDHKNLEGFANCLYEKVREMLG